MYLTINSSDSLLSIVRLMQALGFSDDVITKTLSDLTLDKKKTVTIDIVF